MAGAMLLIALTACGGGVVDDHGQADHLVCASGCKPSDTLATTDMRATFAVVGDGQRVQAQAGFSAGSDRRFNVEITGGDGLQIVTPQGTQGFHIPGSDLTNLVVDVFVTLIQGAKPYVSELTPSGGAANFQVQFVRGSTVLASSVQLPAPYQVTGPASGAVVPVGTRTLTVSLSSLDVADDHMATFNCTDTNGNTATSVETVIEVYGSAYFNGSGVSYDLDIGSVIDKLSFTTNHPRGAVARCDVTLNFTKQNLGQVDARFNTSVIVGQQVRSVAFVMQ